MSALITELIDKVDRSEQIRDEIAAILLLESENQQALAAAAIPAKNPALWDLRVFLERSNPWEMFKAAPDQIDGTPIVNVSLESINYDAHSSNTVERQMATGLYHIDCYGYGISTANSDDYGGHQPGDEKAALEAQRAIRLVRNILMAGAYTYLGPAFRNIVGRRWPQQIQMFQPTLDGKAHPHVVAARLALAVNFNELSPQVAGQTIELISATVKRRETGEIYFEAEYGDET